MKKGSFGLEDKPSQEELVLSKKIISFNDYGDSADQRWECSEYGGSILIEDDAPRISSLKWEETVVETSMKGVSLSNKVYVSIDDIDYGISDIELSTTIVLRDESIFWLVLRCDKEVDEYWAVIKVEKIEESQKVFVSLGTLVKDKKENLVLKIFSKQQLIEKPSYKSNCYVESDSCMIKLNIIDRGEESICVNAFLNDSTRENSLNCEFFLPLIRRKRIMFFGEGDVTMKSLRCNCVTKQVFTEHGNLTSFSDDRKNCNCCMIC